MKNNPALDERMRAEGFVSVQEAAERTGVSASTLYKGLREGAIVGTEVGKRRYLDVVSLLSFVGEGGRTLFERSNGVVEQKA